MFPEQWLGIIGLVGLLINQFIDNFNGGRKDVKKKNKFNGLSKKSKHPMPS